MAKVPVPLTRLNALSKQHKELNRQIERLKKDVLRVRKQAQKEFDALNEQQLELYVDHLNKLPWLLVK